MNDKEKLFSLIKAKYAKGGATKVPGENPIVDAIIDMAEAHARVALGIALLSGNAEVVSNEHITAVIDQALAALRQNDTADIRAELETIYRESFWRRYHQEA